MVWNISRWYVESITRFYGSIGLIDCVAMPITKTIDLSFSINEGRQYRVGKVEIMEISEALKSKLQLTLQPRQVFDRSQCKNSCCVTKPCCALG
jgi:outer membrane protein assembly factor BamA